MIRPVVLVPVIAIFVSDALRRRFAAEDLARASVKYCAVPSATSSVSRVTEPPRAVAEPFIVIESLTSDALAIFEIVLFDPLIVLFVSV